MPTQRLHSTVSGLWELVKLQHGVIARWQLLELGVDPEVIKRRLKSGRLHQIYRGVYAVGRPEVSWYGQLMAAVLYCGPGATVSHISAAELWRMRHRIRGPIHISIPASRACKPQRGIVIHRRRNLPASAATTHHGIPVLSPLYTLADIANTLSQDQLEAAVSEADVRDLIHIEQLRDGLTTLRIKGAASLRRLLDQRTFAFSRSGLERAFRPIARRAGLPKPESLARVNGYEVDFHFPALGLVVETDGGRFHRTPSQQRKDRLRDQAHTMAGLTPLRFTHGQIRYEPAAVEATLRAVAARLSAAA